MRTLLAVGIAVLFWSCSSDQSGKPSPNVATGGGTPACKVSGTGEVFDIAVAKCLAVPLQQSSVVQRPNPRVVLYLDRSASMQGFLDPGYPTHIRTDFRSVIDRLIVNTQTVRAYSYGESIHPFIPSLGTLGNKAFYSDRDTKFESALDSIAKDSTESETHIVVGDARRGSPDRANGQFTVLRTLAAKWVDNGGTFVTAVSLAPFKTVASDPSGCRKGASGDNAAQTCPLYAFAFVAPSDVNTITAALADVFEHVFAWPMPTIPTKLLSGQKLSSSANLSLENHWAPTSDGGWIARVRGAGAASNQELIVQPIIADTGSLTGKAFRAILDGETMTIGLGAKTLTPDAASHTWAGVASRGALVRITGESSPQLAFVTRGREAPRSIVAVDFVPRGIPTWLDSVSAADSADVKRTFGISLLFESFRAMAERKSSPAARLFFVTN